MGKSQTRIMRNSWFYKLRDNIARNNGANYPKASSSSGKDKVIQRTISLPRSNYYQQIACSQRLAGEGFESRGGPKYEKEEKNRIGKAGPKIKGKLLHSKSKNRSRPRPSTLIEARVSAGCSCRATVCHKGKRIVKKSPVTKNKVSKSNFEVSEMEKLGAPWRSMDLLRMRNEGIIRESGKEYSEAFKVSFDGAVKEEGFGFESLQVKPGLKSSESSNRHSAISCSAFFCTCRLSFSDSIDESDESVWEVDFWSEEEEEVVQAPFLNKSASDYNRLVVDMKLNFSSKDLKESAATLCRRSDAVAHAQVQAKLSQMILEKGSKNKLKANSDISRAPQRSDSENFSENGNECRSFVEFHTNEASSQPEIASDKHKLWSEAKDKFLITEIDEIKGNSKDRAKIDRGSLMPRGYWRSTEQKSALKSKSGVNYVSEGQTKISESFAVVKCSYDPRRDFGESMVEMILDNGIRDSQDQKELLDCYLSLNSEEYHDLIMQVFEQVQSDLLGVDV